MLNIIISGLANTRGRNVFYGNPIIYFEVAAGFVILNL